MFSKIYSHHFIHITYLVYLFSRNICAWNKKNPRKGDHQIFFSSCLDCFLDFRLLLFSLSWWSTWLLNWDQWWYFWSKVLIRFQPWNSHQTPQDCVLHPSHSLQQHPFQSHHKQFHLVLHKKHPAILPQSSHSCWVLLFLLKIVHVLHFQSRFIALSLDFHL